MSVIYPDDYPKNMFEALEALKQLETMTDEDIDYSDIPPISDNVIVTPIGQKFIEMGKRNLERMNAELAASL